MALSACLCFFPVCFGQSSQFGALHYGPFFPLPPLCLTTSRGFHSDRGFPLGTAGLGVARPYRPLNILFFDAREEGQYDSHAIKSDRTFTASDACAPTASAAVGFHDAMVRERTGRSCARRISHHRFAE